MNVTGSEVFEGAAIVPPTLSVDEAACMMRLGVDALRELIATGDVPAVSLNRKHCVLLRDDVLSYLRDMARKQADEKKGRMKAARDSVPVARVKRGRPRNTFD